MISMNKIVAAAVLAIGCSVVLSTTGSRVMADVELTGAGATFPNPIYQRWVSEYQKIHSDAKINYNSIGSGGGIKGITDKTIDFAGSDAPLGVKEQEKLGGADNIVQIPSIAGAVVPAYNLPGVTAPIQFTGEVLADIYLGTITKWNDPKIAAINPGVTLPDTAITPVWRTDGSGTTSIFTHYLATQSDDFKTTIGIGKQVKFPVGQGGKGNDGVTAAVQGTVGAIGYIEENYADANNITFGAVENKNGKFVKASPDTVAAAGAGAVDELKGTVLKADIWNQRGDTAYPISSFTYLIVYKDLNNVKSKEQAQTLVDFLWWAIHDGEKLAPELHYAPLDPAVQKKDEDALSTLNYNGDSIKPAVAAQ
jgi:phosphate transport system substrate-binding protein